MEFLIKIKIRNFTALKIYNPSVAEKVLYFLFVPLCSFVKYLVSFVFKDLKIKH